MIALRHLLTETAAGVGFTETPEGLSAIGHGAFPAVIWQREPMPRFQDWIDGLDPACLPATRTTLSARAVPQAVEHLCSLAGTPDCNERNCLIGDISAMACIFAEIMKTDYVSLRLEVVSTHACCAFRNDAGKARLICTYRGTGTQYGLSTDGADPDDVKTVPTCAPIILRGSGWPAEPPCTVLHRAPPLERLDETRLVLVLDPADSIEWPGHQHIH